MSGALDVLVVDDDQNMRLTLAEILSDDGFDVRIACTGEEAVALCRDHVFRLVLMDVRMPGMDGLEAYRQIRMHCKRSQIVLMSAYSNPELERSALQEGVLAFLRKPLDIQVVIKFIAEVTTTAVVCIGAIGDEERRLQAALLENRFRASLVPSVGEALSLTDQIGYDAVVLDLERVSDGGACFNSLREMLPSTPVIVTASPSGPSAEAAREALVHGALGALDKPVSSDMLVTLLEQIKRDHRHRREL